MKRISFNLLILSIILALSGCATNASPAQMIAYKMPASAPKNKNLVSAITVDQIAGGSVANPLWLAGITNEDFKTALIESLRNVNLYHDFDGAKYSLNAKLVKLQQPVIGFNFTVNCEVHYTVQNIKTQAKIYDKSISTSYTAKVSDALVGVIRIRKANEGAARLNIEKFIADLYQQS